LPAERQYVLDTLESTLRFSVGAYVEQFEQQIAALPVLPVPLPP
jgi:hypothetical protein